MSFHERLVDQIFVALIVILSLKIMWKCDITFGVLPGISDIINTDQSQINFSSAHTDQNQWNRTCPIPQWFELSEDLSAIQQNVTCNTCDLLYYTMQFDKYSSVFIAFMLILAYLDIIGRED
jgi:hypothetical protein